jgi:hypothetical protein
VLRECVCTVDCLVDLVVDPERARHRGADGRVVVDNEDASGHAGILA